MGWREHKGHLQFVFPSVTVSLMDDDDLPRTQIWSRADDGYPLESASVSEVQAAVKARFDDLEIPIELLDLDSFWYTRYNIYQIYWPVEVSGLIFNHFWDQVLVACRHYPDFRSCDIIYLAHEIAKAIDKIKAEENLVSLTQPEVDRCRTKYG